MANLRTALGVDELSDKSGGLYRALAAEFIGTMFLNFFGCGAIVSGNPVAISLAFGLSVTAAIQAIGHVSGGHINPAVTIGLVVIGKVPIIRAFFYIIVQCAGAIVGSGILKALSPAAMSEVLGKVFLGATVTPVQGLGVEFFLAMILVAVVCGACDAAKPESKGIAPLIIGLTVTVGHLVGVPRTGAGMNPARSLGASVILGDFKDHWLYWVGPILGGMAGALIYHHIIGPAKQPEIALLPKSYNPVATEDKERLDYIDSGRGAL